MADALEAYTLTVTPSLLDCCPFALPMADVDTDSNPSKKTVAEKTTSFALDVIKTSSGDSIQKLYRVMNLSEISIDLEHHMTQLKLLLVSSHLGTLKAKGEGLLDTISQLLEIVTMLSECQTKVAIVVFNCNID